MAKKIIILERLHEPSDMAFQFVLWAEVPAARQSFYADAEATSAYEQASAAELDAIRTGAVTERVESATYPKELPLPQILTKLEALWQRYQDQVNDRNPWLRYGSHWDGESWTQDGVE